MKLLTFDLAHSAFRNHRQRQIFDYTADCTYSMARPTDNDRNVRWNWMRFGYDNAFVKCYEANSLVSMKRPALHPYLQRLLLAVTEVPILK